MERNELVALMHLMRIAPNDEAEIDTLLQDMRAIAAMAEELPKDAEVIAQEHPEAMQLREDIPADCDIPQELLLANAPSIWDGCFSVPQTVAQGGEG